MKTIATAIILLSFNYLSAQETNFTIAKLGNKYSQDQIINAMNAAEWCGYYFANEAHQIKFDDGSIVEFKSAAELGNIDSSCVSEPFHDKKVYGIHATGRIIVKVNKMETLKVGASSK